MLSTERQIYIAIIAKIKNILIINQHIFIAIQ